MTISFADLYTLLTSEQRRDVWFVLVLTLFMAILDTVGIASILPFITVLTDPDVVNTNEFLKTVYDLFGFSSVDQFQYALGVGTFCLLISSVLIRSLTLWAQLRFTYYGIHTTACRMVSTFLGQPYSWFLNHHSADLATRILSEVHNVYTGIYYQALLIISNILVISLIIVLLLVVDPTIAATTFFVLGGLYLIVFLSVRKYISRLGEVRLKANHERYRALSEAFGGIKDVKSSGLEGVFLNQFYHPSKSFARQSIYSGYIAETPSFVLQGLVFGGIVLLLLYLMSSYGGLDSAIPVVAVYALAGIRFLPALQSIYRSLSQLKFYGTSLDMLYGDLMGLRESARPIERKVNNLDVMPRGFERECVLQQIEYTYPNTESPVLKGIDLSIGKCKTIAFVGSSGSGKTTLVDIILGLLQPQKGQIVLDGEVLTDQLLPSWQKSIGYVSQNIFLAEGTIATNIAFGVPADSIDMQAVEKAAEVAQLDRMLEDMPEKYATFIGEKGVRLSGGQRQRIGIARALYHNPSMLIMDEATSALDNLTEHAVMEAIEQLSGKITIILIAHRLSSVRNCDEIFFLDSGRIIDSGTYDSLQVSCAKFRELVESGSIAR
ncbi:MAG: ABC transporter ATP-binding protein [Candidatus Thiodiazotropha sp.]